MLLILCFAMLKIESILYAFSMRQTFFAIQFHWISFAMQTSLWLFLLPFKLLVTGAKKSFALNTLENIKQIFMKANNFVQTFWNLDQEPASFSHQHCFGWGSWSLLFDILGSLKYLAQKLNLSTLLGSGIVSCTCHGI